MKKSREKLIEVYLDTEKISPEFPDLSRKFQVLKLRDWRKPHPLGTFLNFLKFLKELL